MEISVADYFLYSIDLHHHGCNHGETSESFPRVGEGDYVNKGVYYAKTATKKANSAKVNPPPPPPKNGATFHPPFPHFFN